MTVQFNYNSSHYTIIGEKIYLNFCHLPTDVQANIRNIQIFVLKQSAYSEQQNPPLIPVTARREMFLFYSPMGMLNRTSHLRSKMNNDGKTVIRYARGEIIHKPESGIKCPVSLFRKMIMPLWSQLTMWLNTSPVLCTEVLILELTQMKASISMLRCRITVLVTKSRGYQTIKHLTLHCYHS